MKTAQEIAVTKRDLLKEQEVFYFSDNRPLSLTKLRCKDYYNLFQEDKATETTTVKRWSSFFPYFATSWEQSFNTIYKSIMYGGCLLCPLYPLLVLRMLM